MQTQGKFELGVALPMEKAFVQEDGDLIIEGLAADYSLDRQGEAFVPGCFEKAIGKFLAGSAPLCYHHKHDQQLGQVQALESRADGLYMKAVIPRPPESSPLLDIYNKIKRGMMKGVSVYGSAVREMTANGPKIVDTDLQEISITPMPIGANTLIGVAQKAFPADFGDEGLSPEAVADLRAHFDARYDKVMETLVKASLDAKKRNSLPASSFVFPEDKRYPIHDRAHGANALSRSKGKPEESKVHAAVCKRYPDLPGCQS